MVEETLALYDVEWTLGPLKSVQLDIDIASPLGPRASGDFIDASRMQVDRTGDGLYATTDGGAAATGRFVDATELWAISYPLQLVIEERWLDIEDILTIVLTTGWRRAGWTPLHAGAVVEASARSAQQGRGVLVCAASGGGKTTFTVALVRDGWRALGDDKLLLRSDGPQPVVAAIKQMLNLDPAVAEWFPELTGVSALPPYSTWTPKRRVSLRAEWPEAPAAAMAPTHLVSLVRQSGRGGIRVTPLRRADALDALLRQTVIPRDPAAARPLAASIASLAQRVRSFRLELFDDAYVASGVLQDAMEAVT